jgi:hypothetical protein
MPLRMSTGLVDFLQENGCLKEALHDGVLEVYSGSQPASADAAPTGTLLIRITKESGAFTAGTPSTKRQDKATITYDQDGDDYVIVINGTSYTYTAQAGDDATDVAAGLAALVDASTVVDAIAESNVVHIRAIYGGVDYTIANTGTTTPGNNVIASVAANSRVNGLQFGDSSGGVLSKESATWSGVALATGTAGWARFKANAVDDDTQSTTLVRLDGNISTSNAPFVITSVNIVSGTTETVDSATVTKPKS